ncbi:histone deacetylase [Synechococcus sp. CBW1004]|uniref:histone deacetylase family protein n=1 Tax=Synechococcus sp. CBW1004 TaxID=1353136 RepID=UPI001E652CD4|nr:histone deacetylase [Synechococcus sp. CBW1004]
MLDPRFRLHDTGRGHPECPERLDAIEAALERRGLLTQLTRISARPINDPELLRCHSQAYLNSVRHDVAYGLPELSTGDTAIGDHSEDAVRLAAGGALAAVEAVLDGRVRNAFAALRPPGHHAEAERGMGFCVFNNVALAARHAQAALGIERVLIVDWDVHHGNGTQAIFWRDPSVLDVSVHEWGNYPGSGAADERGEGPGEGFTVNCPLPAGSDGAAVLQALSGALLPAAARFRPQLVLVSAGFDGHRDDPLGRFALNRDDYGLLTELCLSVAREHAGGRLVSVLEGGYNLAALGESCAAHVAALLAG